MLIKNAKVFVGKEFVDADVLFGETIEAVGGTARRIMTPPAAT